MIIAITDANIFIDLIYLGLHALIPRLDLEIYTTQYVLDELDDTQLQTILELVPSGSLVIYTFSDQEDEALSEYNIKRGLSIADHSVIFVADKLAAIVISGDSLVRKTCEEKKLEVHGILWLMDECIRCECLTCKDAHQKLTELLSYNKRLPIKECEMKLAAWLTD